MEDHKLANLITPYIFFFFNLKFQSIKLLINNDNNNNNFFNIFFLLLIYIFWLVWKSHSLYKTESISLSFVLFGISLYCLQWILNFSVNQSYFVRHTIREFKLSLLWPHLYHFKYFFRASIICLDNIHILLLTNCGSNLYSWKKKTGALRERHTTRF